MFKGKTFPGLKYCIKLCLTPKPSEESFAPLNFDSGIYLKIKSVLKGRPNENCMFGRIIRPSFKIEPYPFAAGKLAEIV